MEGRFRRLCRRFRADNTELFRAVIEISSAARSRVIGI